MGIISGNQQGCGNVWKWRFPRSREMRLIRLGVIDGLKWAGMRVVCRQQWRAYDFDAGLVRHCPTCWDDVLKQPSDSCCPDCYGTGFEGGYQGPFLTWARVDEGTQQGENHGSRNNGLRLSDNKTIVLPADRAYHDGDVFAEVRYMEGDKVTRLGRMFQLDGGVKLATVMGAVSDNRGDDRVSRVEDMVTSQYATIKLLLPTDARVVDAERFWGIRGGVEQPSEMDVNGIPW